MNVYISSTSSIYKQCTVKIFFPMCHLCADTHAHPHAHAHANTHADTHVHAHIHVHIHAHVHTHAHKNTHMYTHCYTSAGKKLGKILSIYPCLDFCKKPVVWYLPNPSFFMPLMMVTWYKTVGVSAR